MSGHSHYATTKRQKELKDNARGQVFSKMARAITIAAKSGGGANPDSNFKLRIAIEKARSMSMPKEIIERAISKSVGGEAMDEMMFEGFGPTGVSVLVEVATDNRNRTNPEIKALFDKHGGKLGTPGSVSFNFEPKGMLLVKKVGDADEQTLKLIDLGAEDIEDVDSEFEIYVAPTSLSEMQKKLSENGLTVSESLLIQKPKNFVEVPEDKTETVTTFLDNIDAHDDVQAVFTNAKFTK